MIRALLLLLAGGLISGCCWSQRAEDKTSLLNSKNGEPVAELNTGARQIATALKNVLFATNEDCDLYINDEYKSAVSKNAHKYLQLAPGRYTYKAKSKSTKDELQETFLVTEGGLNEIFIDLLYVMDEKNAQQQSLQNAGATGKQVDKAAMEKAAINSLLSNMIPIKGGDFIMGNNKAPASDELEHPVSISPVLFSKYEVTQQQWEQLMGYNPSENKGCPDCPVENVSWEEVMKFIRKVNVVSGKKFRLPTEAEWEYVARLGGKEELEKAGGPEEYIRNTAWYFGNSDKKTHAVGQKQPNAAGVYDLFGNVSEWCSDWYGSYYYKEELNQIDPEGPPLGKEKVVRGGSFMEYSGDRFRPSFRNKLKPTSKSKDIGFRLVMESR